MRLSGFVSLSRPHFLLGGMLLYAVGAVAVGIDSWFGYFIGQLAITASQLTAHFVNEYADAEVDRHILNRTWFSGGSGVLTEPDADRAIALRAAYVTTVVSLVAAMVLALDHRFAALIAASTLLISWGYSMPPVRLLDTGWGEAATTVVTVIAVPLVGALSQSGRIDASLWWAISALYALHIAMIVVFEMPDIDSDADAGKTVLAVRLGKSVTHRVIAGSYVLGFAVAALGAVTFDRSLTWMLVGLPLAVTTVRLVGTDRYRLLTTAAVATLAVSTVGALLAVG